MVDRLRGFLTGPAEGSLEDFTLRDIPLYVRKLLLGPISPKIPSQFSRLPLPDRDPHDAALTMTLFGDIMFWRRMPRTGEGLYARLPSNISRSDLTLANLEFPVLPDARPRGFPRFNGTREYFRRVALPLRPHALSLANNHCLDQGAKGLESTAELVESEGIAALGVGRGERQYRLFEIAGTTVALAAYTYSTNGRPLPEKPPVNRLRLNAPGSDGAGLEKLLATVGEMRRAADLVILSLHWGFEFELAPRDPQVRLAHRLMEAGVDVIAGHHPHVLQPVESFQAGDGRSCLCFYSLGNWTSGMLPRCTRVVAAVQVGVSPNEGCTALRSYPLYFDRRGPSFRPLTARAEDRLRQWVPRSLQSAATG
ncbi:MAG: CapA family protein [Candidatus Bipolaricaulota bacterium]